MQKTMEPQQYHLAQFNIAVLRAPIEDPLLQDFVNRLDEINHLAERSPGFVWRLQDDDGNSTSIRAYDDERILINMSVWESIEALEQFAYHSHHIELLRNRGRWFEPMDDPNLVLWWVAAGHTPDASEGVERLATLTELGPTAEAFTYRKRFPPPGPLLRRITA